MLSRMAAGVALAGMSLVGAARADVNLTDLEADAAAAQQTAVQEGWQGSVAIGYIQTTGNSNTSTANGKVLAGYKTGRWQDSVLFQALKASQEGVLTAENFEFDGQADYNLNPNNYIFGNADYLRDVFSGYTRRTSEVIGVGHRVLNTNTQQLDLEIGGGRRQTHYTTGAPSDSEFVERGALSYLWKFSDTSNITETLSVVRGASNVLSQSVSALTANLASSFALSLSYTVTHNSQVQPGFKRTDAVTALSLVYSFVPTPQPAPPPPPPATPAIPPP